MSSFRSCARAITIGALCVSLAGCSRGSAGETEAAFCDAVAKNDAAAAKAIFDAAQIDMMAGDFSGKCQPGLRLVQRAVPQLAEFTAMAVAFVKRPGIANTCWSTSKGTGGAGCAITIAAQNANPAVMRALVESGVTVTGQTARGAVNDAANQGSLEIVQMLVEKGADPQAGITAAVSRRATAIVDYLESKGAKEDAAPLLVAARRGDVAGIDAALAAKADLEVTDGSGRTPLIRAAFYGHAPIVARMAKAGANVNAATPDDHHTALHIAANEGHVAVIQALIAAQADVNARAGADAPTPLLVAIDNAKADAVRALLAGGADANAFTESGTTALGRAVSQGHFGMVRALLSAGARVNDKHGAQWQPPIPGVVGLCGEIPAGDTGNDTFRVPVLKALVAAGADTKAVNADGKAPLDVLSALLAGTSEPFYKACYQAKIDVLTARAPTR